MLKTRTIHFILNASSGVRSSPQGGNSKSVVTEIMRAHGLEAQIHETSKDTDLCELTRKLIRDGAEVVSAGGGDGTVNAVASVLAGTDVTMGVIPIGTLNHFARDLQIPIDVRQAAEVIANGHTARVDIGEVNGKRFINNAIVGLYPAYRFQRERHQRRGRAKWLAMSSAVYGVIRRNPAFDVRVDAEGEQIVKKTPFLMVANNVHEMEGYRLGSRKSCSEGLLALYVMHRMSRARLLGLAFRILIGRFSKAHDFDVLTAREITVESRRKRMGISLDGEVVRMNTPFHYKSLPGALRVLVPSTYSP